MPPFPNSRSRAFLLVLSLIATQLLAASPAAAAGGGSFIDAVNTLRVDAGRAPARADALVDRVAVERGGQLAAERQLVHDLAYVKVRFAQLGVCWDGLGEIIAENGARGVAAFVDQWDHSPPHHAIMLNDTYSIAGGSWARGSDGVYYAVMLFVDPCGQAPGPGGFTDIGSSAFRNDITWLVDAGITHGCDTSRYCPGDTVTREQMASLLGRATHLAAAQRDWFVDDNASSHEADINRVASAAITRGCDADLFCPHGDVTRAQMASFLERALDLPPATHDWFSDDRGSIHESAINQLAEAGITGGCAPRRFCPDATVTREQMAAFLHRAFG